MDPRASSYLADHIATVIANSPSTDERREFLDRVADTFMSRNARDMWMIGTRMAGFDPEELWAEITRRKTKNAGRINEPTVLNAMSRVRRY